MRAALTAVLGAACAVLTAHSDPLYACVRMGATQATPCVIHLFGRYHTAVGESHFVPHANLTRDGLHPGTNNGIEPANLLVAGEESAWVDLSGLLAPKDETYLRFEAIVAYRTYVENADFTVLLSRTPSADGIVHRFGRRGPGAGLQLTIDPDHIGEASSNVLLSAQARDAALSLPAPPGRRPRRFPVLTGVSIDPLRDPAEVIASDLATVSALGFSGAARTGVAAEEMDAMGLRFASIHGYLQSGWCEARCWLQPNPTQFERGMARYAGRIDTTSADPSIIYWSLGDEYGSRTLDRIRDESGYHDGFRRYLQEQGLTPAQFGAAEWSELHPVGLGERLERPALYYYSVGFQTDVIAQYLRYGTECVQRLLPNVPTAMNIAESLTYEDNMLYRGVDWFHLYASKALTYGFTETWMIYEASSQTCGYSMSMMRAACREPDLPFAFYLIVQGSEPWAAAAKAFTAVGHGARALYYYNYGPRHNGVIDAFSHKPDVFPYLQQANFAIGAVEDELLDAVPVPSRIAMLYSRSTDVWRLDQHGNADGAERKGLYLLLRHLGYSIDFITEQEVLAGRAADFDLIFLLGSHLLTGVGEQLLAWTAKGGTLYVGAGSAARDQFNEIRDPLTAAGLHREPLRTIGPPPWRPLLSYSKLQSHGQVEAVDGSAVELPYALQTCAAERDQVRLRTADGRAVAAEFGRGLGRLIFCGCLLGVDYSRTAIVDSQTDAHGRVPASAFPARHRELLRELLAPWPEAPVMVSDPSVEANLLQTPRGYVIALANWAGARRTVDIDLSRLQAREVRAAIAEDLSLKRADNRLRSLSLELELGDFLIVH